MHLGNNAKGRDQGGVSALFLDGVNHVAKHLVGAEGEQAIGIAQRLQQGLKVAHRPPEFARGVLAATGEVLKSVKI